MSIGSRIKLFRKELNMTQKEVSEKINISRTYFSDIENDRQKPSLSVLQNIADALSVSTSSILEDNSVDEHRYNDYNGEKYKEDTEILLEELHKNPNLKTLLFEGKDVSPESLKLIIEMVKKMK